MYLSSIKRFLCEKKAACSLFIILVKISKHQNSSKTTVHNTIKAFIKRQQQQQQQQHQRYQLPVAALCFRE
jgi:hypothetical protein